MKKFGLFLLGAIALIVLLTQIGPMIGLLVSLAVLFFAFKQFIRADSAAGKMVWAIIGLIALGFAVGNVPAIIGVAALLALYFVYKKWDDQKTIDHQPKDPFDNFEKQWKEMM